MNHREVMQQALEFCEFLWRDVPLNDYSEDMRQDVEAALRAALAEPPHPPFIAATAIEQQAYAFGWWHGLDKGREMLEALQIIATPQRPDGTWNRDREACRQLAAEALGFHNKGGQDE